MKLEKQWIIKKALFDKTFIQNLQIKTKLPVQLLQFLSLKGYVTEQMINKLLSPIDESNFLFYKDGKKLIELMLTNKDKKILIYSDFDCDGLCSAAIASYGLNSLGYQTSNYVNSRFEDGYGFKDKAIYYALENNCQVILALDHGISDIETIENAKKAGLTVLLIDHHIVPEKLPPADAIVDLWQQDDTSEFKSYSSGALAFQFIKALASKHNYTSGFNELLGLVALCTISDVMELRETNRYYIKEGLKIFNTDSLVCYKVINDKMAKALTIDDLRFVIAPQINAVGRITDDTKLVLKLFLSVNYKEAEDYYEVIRQTNQKRQLLTKIQLEMAKTQINSKDTINVIVGDFHEGLVGLLAGRIKSETGKLTIVLSKKEDILKGSIRSLEEVALQKYLKNLSNLLISYGGHDMAAGISLYEKDLAEFSAQLKAKIKREEETTFEYLDYVYQTEHLKSTDISQWELLEPYGPGFEYPTFGLLIQNYRYQILKDSHIKLTTDNITIMAFNSIGHFEKVKSGKPLKAIVRFEKDRYNNYQAILIDDNLRYYK